MEAVVALGESAVPILAATLRHGPAPARIATIERELTEAYAKRITYARSHPEAAPARSEQEYIDGHRERFVALYKSRAALALGEIGSSAAMDSLRRVAGTPDTQSEVARAVREALRRQR